MGYLILALAALIFVAASIYLIRNSSAAQISRFLRWFLLIIALALASLLIIFNKLNYLWAIFPLIAPWFSPRHWVGRQILRLLLPMLYRRFMEKQAKKAQKQPDADTKNDDATIIDAQIIAEKQKPMPRAEAMLILGVNDDVSMDDIKTAYQHKLSLLDLASASGQKQQKILRHAYLSLLDSLQESSK